MKKKYKSEASAAVHGIMEGMFEICAIDKQTMREFDEACVTPIYTLLRTRHRRADDLPSVGLCRT